MSDSVFVSLSMYCSTNIISKVHLLQSGGECVRAFLAKGYNQLTTLNIGGVSGTDYALQVQHKALFSLNTKPRFLIFAHEC